MIKGSTLTPTERSNTAPRKEFAPFLPIDFAPQSTFKSLVQSQFRRRQALTLFAYSTFVSALACLSLFVDLGATAPFALGLTFPGAGFLHWLAGGQLILSGAVLALGVTAFMISLVIWFATGNVLAPLATWIGTAALAAFPELIGLAPTVSDYKSPWIIGPSVALAGWLFWLLFPPSLRTGTSARLSLPRGEEGQLAPMTSTEESNARLRLLLDRALQPRDTFRGFEWRDQFQTAAVRYQVNFLSYAVSMAKARHAPSASAYLDDAQEQLMEKIGSQRLWRYWGLENAWGNLKLNRDPIPHQNIMYSGFTLLQMALAGKDCLRLKLGSETWRSYLMDDIAEALKRQYCDSSYGLLACEPNWIYPLCNLITMAGIKASDTRLATDRWESLREPFLASLDREATRSDGSFIAFRSSLTGFAPPAPGGIVMQAFPCLFLNTLSPERAQEQWHYVRSKLDSGSWKRLFWPIDTGNYGFSRASGYSATAAAAVEMGDVEVANECLRLLEIECPTHQNDGVVHRSNASLWAHALEVFARSNRPNGLSHLIGSASTSNGPHLASLNYEQAQILFAQCDSEGLEFALVPTSDPVSTSIKVSGLQPHREYTTGLRERRFITADAGGCASFLVSLSEETRCFIRPAF